MEAAAKTVQSMIAALGAAGAVMVLLLVIIVGIIGGAAFSGSSESSEALSQEVLSYTSTIQKYANQYGIPEYVSVIQEIMMQESGGRGTDPMGHTTGTAIALMIENQNTRSGDYARTCTNVCAAMRISARYRWLSPCASICEIGRRESTARIS